MDIEVGNHRGDKIMLCDQTSNNRDNNRTEVLKILGGRIQ